MTVRFSIKASQYVDSVALMNIAREVQGLPGIDDAALVMGTEANKRLLTTIGTLSPEVELAQPTDLIVMVEGEDSALEQALAKAEDLLIKPAPTASSAVEYRPCSLRGAISTYPETNLAVISVSGTYAAAEAWDALYRGLHVLLFSDNVSLDDEIALKQYAVENGLLLMGPGAGTAIVNGVALGFANVVPRGPVGIVSAAGTGLQEVSTLLAREGIGVSQAIGVGGRDLSDQVSGLMMFHGLDALQLDPNTDVIVAISKLPSSDIAEQVITRLSSGGKPSVVIFMGESAFSTQTGPKSVYMADTLQEAALVAARLVQGGDVAVIKSRLADQSQSLQKQARQLGATLNPQQIYLRGLFSGGTLCEEAIRIWSHQLGNVWSNAPLHPEYKLPDSTRSQHHCALDLGDEEFTVGRLHPMMDNDLRIRRLLQEARDPQTAVIQLDVVLGYGAHPNPASELAPVIGQAKSVATREGRELLVVCSIVGTEADPQNLKQQQQALEGAGALVLHSNAEASLLATFLIAAHQSAQV